MLLQYIFFSSTGIRILIKAAKTFVHKDKAHVLFQRNARKLEIYNKKMFPN